MTDKEKLFNYIENKREDMISLQTLLTSIPAISPDSGGHGEIEKGEKLVEWLRDNGFSDIKIDYSPDRRCKGDKRPNILVTIPGEEERAICVMTHIDVVPPGEESLWVTDPYTVVEKDGKLFGRGVEDNQQGMVASIFAAKALMSCGIKPRNTIKLLFVSDEEVGSKHGIIYLLKKNSDFFSKGDLFIVPDGGDPEGKTIEIAEKKVLWLKFITKGLQCHASRPEQGANAFLAASDLVIKLSRLGEVFNERNEIFDPPVSTFSPTKKESNVLNVNTIPGEDVFYIDSRILPVVDIEDVLLKVEEYCREIEKRYRVKVSYEIIQKAESPATSAESSVVSYLKNGIAEVYDVKTKLIGIGGGTVATYLRKKGYDTVVWSKIDETCHTPNEYCIIQNMIDDSRVLSVVMLNGCSNSSYQG